MAVMGWCVWVVAKEGQEPPALPEGYTKLRTMDNGDLIVFCPNEPFARALASDLSQEGYTASAYDYLASIRREPGEY